MSINIERINTVLSTSYGRNINDQPIFRIVFSDDQREKRFGEFSEFYGSIFLRKVSGLREVPKYSYIAHRWVLERWAPPALAYTPEIPESSQGSYEPVFVFEGSVIEPLVHEIIWRLFHPELPGHRASQMKQEEEKSLEKEIEHNREVLEDQGRSWIGHRLHSGEAIVKP